MLDVVKKYWLALVAAFAGGAVVSTGYMMGHDPVTAHHTLTSTVEWMGESVGMMHEDPGNQYSNFLLYATGTGVSATKGAVKDLKEKVEELGKNVRNILDKEEDIKDAKNAAHDAKSKVEKMSERNADLVDQIKELQDDQSDIKDMVEEVDMKFQDASGRSSKDVGREFVSQIKEQKGTKSLEMGSEPAAGDTYKAKMKGVGIKDITNVSSSAGAVVFPDEREEIISSPVLRTPQIMDLLTILETGKDAIEYVKQVSETDAASSQSGQGSALSQSDFGFELRNETIETIGHVAKSSVQILNDAPRLRSWINTRMRSLLELEAEDQALLGDGTNNNLDGLVPNASSYKSGLESAVADSPITDIDKIGVMLLQLERNNYPPTGIVLSPLNWYGIQLTKDNDDNYQFVNPQGSASPRLWGFPVVSSNAMREGEALVGNFEMAATFYDRRQTTLQISTENSDDFEKLMVTMRAYLRGLLAVERSDALIHNSSMDTTPPTGS